MAKGSIGLSLSYHQLEANRGGSWPEESTQRMFVKLFQLLNPMEWMSVVAYVDKTASKRTNPGYNHS